MKIYEANPELIEVLNRNGFMETTSEIDKKKTKKSFKLAKQSKKEIHFDYANITVIDGSLRCDSRIKMTETELKSLLLYFKLNTTDLKEISESKKFNFVNIENRIVSLRNELKLLKDVGITNIRQKKIARIVETFEEIKLN
jgi:hypothetical protein